MVKYQVAIPPVELAFVFSSLTKRFIDFIHQKIFESRTLAALRDALLPKLLLGELGVDGAEKALERAL